MAATRCAFAGKHCDRKPDESGMCPRHNFMVATMGEEAARIAELGVMCEVCVEFVDEVGTCVDCKMENVCSECRAEGVCCDCDMDAFDDDWDDEEDDDGEDGEG